MMYHGKYINNSFQKYFAQNAILPDNFIFIDLHTKHFGIGDICPNFKAIAKHKKYVSQLQKTAVIVTDEYRGIKDPLLLPKNCVIFSSNMSNDSLTSKVIHIPLLNNNNLEIELKNSYKRKYLYSFIGWNNCSIRAKLAEINQDNGLISFKHVENKIFNEIMSDSVFSLCPRGIEESSYRICEALRHESIPVYISDKFVIPEYFDKYGILINENDILSIPEILNSYTEERINELIKAGRKYYKKLFTYEGLSKWIIEQLIKIK
jgi:hypothetical protein